MRAFSAAIEFQKGRGVLPSKARRVVETIRRALNQDKVKVLSVLDNGVGLDERRMTALLSDGVSAKEASSAGTYGNGHSVAIPASDLRYALYGGLTVDGTRIAAGHAVLASHVGDYSEFASSGDGFLVRGFQNGKDGTLFKYARGDRIPPLIASDLDDVACVSDHGTTVILPAFNSFRENRRSLEDLVLEAAACNFFVAIQQGRLEVWIEDAVDGGPDLMLDASTLEDKLREHRERKRSRAFLSGARAFEAYRAVQLGEPGVIETSQGKIEVWLRQGTETTRIDLCRNGMWIADDKGIPGFYYKFTDRVPFHAVLLLDAERGGRLHQLVRDAEGPLHDKIRLKDLSKVERTDLRVALGEIRESILANTRQAGGDSFDIDDFLAIDFGEDSPKAGGTSATSHRGRPFVVKRWTPTWYSTANGNGRRIPQPKTGKGKTDQTRRRRSPVLNSAFQAISLPSRRHRRRIFVTCSEACEDAVLRLRVNENVDATCDSLWHEIVPVILEDVQVDGKGVHSEDLVSNSGEVVGVRLGALSPGQSVEVETGYRVPDAFGSWRGHDPSLKVEIVEGGPSGSGSEAP